MTDLRIVDPCTPRPYDTMQSLRGLGGTEATVMRVANALSAQADIVIEQSNRTTSDVLNRIRFRPLELSARDGKVIVVINSWKVALKLRRANPSARILVWLHVHPGRHNRQMGARLREAGIDILCVSRSHTRALQKFLSPRPEIGFIYNPVPDDLKPDQTLRQRDRLIFASSPHKGLPQVLGLFASARLEMPDLTLVLANPGYMRWPLPALPEGTVIRGALSHAEVIAEFRRALCLFYPQSQFSETFGLVIAEANAVGCPALLHGDIGANREIASTPEQCIDAADTDGIIARLKEWQNAHPRIGIRPEFRLSAVAAEWAALLQADSGSALPGSDPGECGDFSYGAPPHPADQVHTAPAAAARN